MSALVVTALVLGIVGIVGAVVLYIVLRFFRVEEDERIGLIEELLPGANCGACGRNGCHDFAVACVGATALDGLNCPGAGSKAMAEIGRIVGLAAMGSEPQVAVVRCNGAREKRRKLADFDGVATCEIISFSISGCYSCPFGCLGCGDCVGACRFGAMCLDEKVRLPMVDDEKCTGCGECVRRCPKSLIELRPKGKRGQRVWVACSNRDKGAAARQSCEAACIGCGKCMRACPFGAVAVADNLAYIDAEKCRLCRKCVAACPTGAIHTVNFPKPLDNRVSEPC